MINLTRKLQSLRSSFPLLNKELTEQANRKRTYAFRAILIVIIGFFIVLTIGNSNVPQNSIYRMARLGNDIFAVVMICQFFAVVVLLPGMMSAVVTVEKERSSLELLFLTSMKPWEIIVQKYLSRIIPCLMFYFLGLPVLAIAYSFGGLDGEEVRFIPLIILTSIFHIGAFSLMFSTLCATTVMAAVSSYLMLVLGFLFFIIIGQYSYELGFRRETDIFYFAMIVQIITTFLFLGLSMAFLRKRADAKSGHHIRKGLDTIDRLWFDINRLFGGIMIIKDEKNPLPSDNPLAWYEKIKSPVGRLSYRIRLSIIAYLPVLACLMMNVGGYRSYRQEYWFQLLLVVYLLVLAVLLCSNGASVISAERTRQTLDILLTTPLSAAEIIREKMKRTWTYIGIFTVPIFVLAFLVNGFSYSRRGEGYLLVIAMLIFAYMPMISWLSCLVGLIVKNQGRAILTSFMLLILWLLFPLILLQMSSSYKYDSVLMYLSPTVPVFEAFFKYSGLREQFTFTIISLVVFGFFIFLRTYCLRNADRYLRRR